MRAKKKQPKYPLRKIVGYVKVYVGTSNCVDVWVAKERLECGHTASIKIDAYGETNALRRRCKKCVRIT